MIWCKTSCVKSIKISTQVVMLLAHMSRTRFMATLPRIHVDYHFSSKLCFGFLFLPLSFGALVAVIIHMHNVALERWGNDSLVTTKRLNSL
jgi:hypothetical protein